jgi:hypothetical protein
MKTDVSALDNLDQDRRLFTLALVCFSFLSTALSAHAQEVQTTGERSSPSGTTTIDGEQLPVGVTPRRRFRWAFAQRVVEAMQQRLGEQMTKDAANQFFFCGGAAITSAALEELTDLKRRKAIS